MERLRQRKREREKRNLLKCITCQSLVTSEALLSVAACFVCLSRLPSCHSFWLLSYCKEGGNKRGRCSQRGTARTANTEWNSFQCLSGKDFQAVGCHSFDLRPLTQLSSQFRLLPFVLLRLYAYITRENETMWLSDTFSKSSEWRF